MSKTNIRSNQLIKAVLFVTAITFASSVNATPVHDGDKTKAEQMQVRMADATDAEIVVEVKVSNEEAKRLVLVIENERGEELYSKDIDKAGFRYRLRFPKSDNIPVYTIKLKAGARAMEQYKIVTTSRVVEDVTISKM
jgi:type III secretory pathway component EscV